MGSADDMPEVGTASDDDLYSGQTAMDSQGGDDNYDYGLASDNDEVSSSRQKQIYTIMTEADIRQCQEDDITKVSTVLSVSRVSACILLLHYKWSVSKVHDEWFTDEYGVRKAVGLLEKPMMLKEGEELSCGICFDMHPHDEIHAAACGHPFCTTCWRGYISTSINDGPGCLMLRCPDPSCDAAIGQDMIDMLVPGEDKEKYTQYLCRSYIEENKKTKWCPAPGCNYAAKFVAGGGSFDVTCLCMYSFCWNCTEETHRPVSCDTVAKWILKNNSESGNVTWILCYTKPCPKCRRPIEKNLGCMHMSCPPPCGFQFCWLCLGSWEEHCRRTGAYNACNQYQSNQQDKVLIDDEMKRERARNSLERYTHYYERWAANHSSRTKALADLNEMQTVHLKNLIQLYGLTATQLKFIIEACLQIVECRRVLKWTYAYGYYIPEQEHSKKELFEYLQGEAESGLERLHQCVEKELLVYASARTPAGSFNSFRIKLTQLTMVTRNYFQNLVTALENGLSEVDAQRATR